MPSITCNSPGFSEAVISVSDIDSWITFLERVFKWEVVCCGEPAPGVHGLWRLPKSARIVEAFVRDPNAQTDLGAIRLVQFSHIDQQQARPNAYAWDTGGFFDLHVQVRDVHALFEDMQRDGWSGYTPVQRLEVGGVVLDEVLIHGPDGMAFALIERVSPPFQVVEGYRRVSPAWNAPQMVADFSAVHRFYADGLGFIPTIETEMPPAPNGDNLYGLPLSVGKQIPTQLAFLHPTGTRGAIGSVDLLHLVGLEGRRLGSTTRPPNFGLVLLRYPVSDLDAYIAAIGVAGIKMHTGPVDIELDPIGSIRVASVLSPEGAWIEFYEQKAGA